jgi:Fic family protein
VRLPQRAPTFEELLSREDLVHELGRIVAAIAEPDPHGRYAHWDDVRREPPPEGLSREARWLGLKFRRGSVARALPLRSTEGRPLTICLTDTILETLHWIDQHGAGEILISEGVTDPGQRQRYLVSSLMEESIASSQLEGASVTRKVAREMLRTGRSPRDKVERMILNNFRAMSRLRDMALEPLTRDMILELHRILTDGTLDDPGAAGRIQRSGEDRVRVVDPDDQVVHVPPPAEELGARLDSLVRFANGETPASFLHPVVRAIALHFWLAYDHPFEDGNGRTARALFYWAMLRSGYWILEYLSISSLLVKAPAQYARAFQHTETDEFDGTYFVLHQLRVVRLAVDALIAYLRRKMAETRETLRLLPRTSLNHRQVALLAHALRHPDAEYTIRSHATSHGVVNQSARTDLIDLQRRGLVERRTAGRAFHFYPAADLAARLDGLSG